MADDLRAEQPNPWQVLADELLAAGLDRLTAANIVATTSEAAFAAKQADAAHTCHLCDWPRPIDLDKHWHAVHLAKPEES